MKTRLKQIAIGLATLLALPIYGWGGVANGVSSVDTKELRTTTSLMQNWKFVQDDTLTDEAALRSTGADWKTVSLPHTWNAHDAASLHATKPYRRGIGWYRLEFDTPSEGARHWLEFGAASIVADVWLNGQKLGQHRGAFTAFRFDVTDRLATSRKNVLLVKTDNREPNDEADPTVRADNISTRPYPRPTRT
jgi:beta-galactosidase